MNFTMRFSFKLSTVDSQNQMVTFSYKNTSHTFEAESLLDAQNEAWKLAMSEALRQCRMETIACRRAVHLAEVKVTSVKSE